LKEVEKEEAEVKVKEADVKKGLPLTDDGSSKGSEKCGSDLPPVDNSKPVDPAA
jgi:hypothetical protein